MTKTYDEWVPILEGMPYAPIQSVKEAANDPQAQAAGCFISYEHPRHGRVHNLASPINMSETPATYRRQPRSWGNTRKRFYANMATGPKK